MEVQRLERKKEKAKAEGNLTSLFSCCKELADIFFRQEDYNEALKEYEELLQVSQSIGNKMDIARAHRMIGEVYSAKGEFDEAIKHQLVHLASSREEGDIVEEQRALATLGRTYFLMSESLTTSSTLKTESLRKAKNNYLESLSVCERLNDDLVGHKQKMEMRARLFLNLGLVHDSQGCYDKGIESLSKAVIICKKLDLWEDLYRGYSALASVHQHHGDNNNSIANYDLAISVATRLPEKIELLCECLPLKAEVLLHLPDFRGARQTMLKAYKLKASCVKTRESVENKLRIVAAMCDCEKQLLNLAPDKNFKERKKLYESIGDMAIALHNYKIALTYYHLMLECVEKSGNNRKELIDCYVSLSQTYSDVDDYQKALIYFKKQLNLEKENPAEASKTNLNIADCLEKMGDFNGMVEHCELAKKYAKEAKSTKLEKAVDKFTNIALVNCGKIDSTEILDVTTDEIDDEEESSSPEDEVNAEGFGTMIDLDNLTDEEGGDNEEFDRLKPTRSRGKTNSIMKRNEKGETPLHTACISGNKNLVKKLLEQGHSVDVKDYSGWTPLHEACNHGFVDIVNLLLDHGSTINDRGGPMCDGVTPLLDAASNGCLDVMDVLLDRGASPLMRNNRGDSVIDCLVAWRQRYVNDVGHDLNPTNRAHYDKLVTSVQLALEKAGQKVPLVKESQPDERLLTRTRMRTPENIDYIGERSLEYRRVSECRKSPPVGAATEYETAIKALRHRSKPEKMSNIARHNMPALLNDFENVWDDWLEDDLQPKLKKRKTLSRDAYTTGQGIRNRISPPSSPQVEESEDSCDSDVKSISEELVSTSNIDREMPSVSGSSSNKLKVVNNTRKKQISLMTTGMTIRKVRRSSESGNHPEEISCPTIPENDSSSVTQVASAPSTIPLHEQINPTPAPEARANPTTIAARLKVRIEGKLFLIAVPSSINEPLTIKWLNQQAVKRYYNLEGVEPVIQLTTDDGALLDESDPIEVLYSSSEVVGLVQSWKVETIRDRYSQACSRSNINEDPKLVEILEACQATSEVVLEDMFLPHSKLEPVLKALSCHLPLHVLVLSGNKLSDQTLKVVIDCIEKLPHLNHLDLSNTCLTSSRMTLLTDSIKKSSSLKNLQKLFIGYNPLYDCFKSLTSLLELLPSLTKLSLPMIYLSHKYFRHPSYLCLDRIEWLDISDNDLGKEGVNSILSRLDAQTLCHIAMSHVGPAAVQELALFLQIYQPPSLSYIDLSYCSPTNQQMQELLKGIEVTPRLETLILDGTDLTNESLQQLLNLDLTKLSLGGTEVSGDITTQIKSLTISSHSDLSRGKAGPFGSYTISL